MTNYRVEPEVRNLLVTIANKLETRELAKLSDGSLCILIQVLESQATNTSSSLWKRAIELREFLVKPVKGE